MGSSGGTNDVLPHAEESTSNRSQSQPTTTTQTKIHLPHKLSLDPQITETTTCPSSSKDTICDNCYLSLPSSNNVPMDVYLSTIPAISQSAKWLLNNKNRRLICENSCSSTSQNPKDNATDDAFIGKILYICQGEVGHAISSQCDVIASDDATTCHIVAMTSSSGKHMPLSSMAHIDQPKYEGSIREMVMVHKRYHHKRRRCGFDDDMNETLGIDLHIMGGFNDANGSSRDITDFLLRLFAKIAKEEWDHGIRITLRTCAVSILNDTGSQCPVGRGLGIDTRSGEVYLASVDPSTVGPAIELRSCRIYDQGGNDGLSVIHNAPPPKDDHESSSQSEITIAPFRYKIDPYLSLVVNLPDDVMKKYTSTSPEVERDDFCDSIRRSYEFMKRFSDEDVFGKHCDRPVRFRRSDKSVGDPWIPIL